MHIERPGRPDLTPEELQHLEKVRKQVRDALSDGKVSVGELDDLNRLIQADRKITPEELQVIRETTREMLGSSSWEYDWG